MTRYALNEAYSNIYDHRTVEDIFDNLRFIDTMLDEDIQEVVEELVWEFRDYGKTLDEAIESLYHAASPEVITESYYVLMDDVLTEATRLTPQQRQQRISRNRAYQQSSNAAADATQRKVRADQRSARINTAISNAKKSLSGPIRSVKQSISGAAGGIGRAGKALGGAAVEKGKALLKGLLRRGGQAATATGRAIERSGKAAAEKSTRITRADYEANKQQRQDAARAAVGTPFQGSPRPTASTDRPIPRSRRAETQTATTPAADTETTTSTAGGKRRAVGRALRSIGAAMQRRAGRPQSNASAATPSTSSGRPQGPFPYNQTRPQGPRPAPAQGPRRPQSNEPAPSAAPTQTGPVRSSIGRVSGPASSPRRPAAPTSSARRYPTEPSGQTTLFTQPVKGKSAGADVKVPAGGQRKFGVKRRAKATERTRQMPLRLKEDYELLTQYIAEDIVNAGYADDLYEAFDIIQNLDEETLSDIIADYID